MTIRIATLADLPLLVNHDHHISEAEFKNLIILGRVSVAEVCGEFAGWLRWNLFWDNTPFLNMLFLLVPHRGKGFGRELIAHWEAQMIDKGFNRVMTSTASDEYAQHFYQKLGYTAIGGFTPAGEAYELIFEKRL